MKGLKKVALASAIAAVSAGAQAELKALDDAAMGELTGQSGLTIDLETKYTIGEFMYKDEGSVFFKGLSLGANENDAGGANAGSGANGFVDNIRIKLDIAGDNEALDYGFSRVQDLATFQAAVSAGNPDLAKFAAAAGGDVTISDFRSAAGLADNAYAGFTNTGATNALFDASGNLVTGVTDIAVQAVDNSGNLVFDTSGNPVQATDNSGNLVFEGSVGEQSSTITSKKNYDDGDLVIHVSFKDAWQKNGGLQALLATGGIGALSFEQLLEGGLKSVDFNFGIDAIGLAASTVEAGDTITRNLMGHTSTGIDADGADTTVLISNLDVNGFLGPVDIHIENDGNGFSLQTALGALPTIGKADSVINWDSYVNITDLDVYLDIAGVQITGLKMNNVRGDVTDLDGNFSFGFAHSKRDIYAVRNTANFDSTDFLTNHQSLIGSAGTVGLPQAIIAIANASGEDGVAIDTTFKGDMEIGALSFGDTDKSIGELYWTDINRTTNWTISAH